MSSSVFDNEIEQVKINHQPILIAKE
jgi:hypothetical protein